MAANSQNPTANSSPTNTTPNSMQVPNTPKSGGMNAAQTPVSNQSSGGWNTSGSMPGSGFQSMYGNAGFQPAPTFRGSRQPIGVGRTIGYGNQPMTQMVQQNQRDLAGASMNPNAPTYQALGLDPRVANDPNRDLYLGVSRGTMTPQQAEATFAARNPQPIAPHTPAPLATQGEAEQQAAVNRLSEGNAAMREDMARLEAIRQQPATAQSNPYAAPGNMASMWAEANEQNRDILRNPQPTPTQTQRESAIMAAPMTEAQRQEAQALLAQQYGVDMIQNLRDMEAGATRQQPLPDGWVVGFDGRPVNTTAIRSQGSSMPPSKQSRDRYAGMRTNEIPGALGRNTSPLMDLYQSREGNRGVRGMYS